MRGELTVGEEKGGKERTGEEMKGEEEMKNRRGGERGVKGEGSNG